MLTYLYSIEEDFVTWKEGLWPAVIQSFGVDTSQAVQIGREYEITVHTDLASDKVFCGEPNRLGSFNKQKPYVKLDNSY